MYKNSLHETTIAASGYWRQILSALAPHVPLSIRHKPCPVHGGKDGFRMFNDFELKGGAICNTCGAFSSGFSLLAWVNDASFTQTVQDVRHFLNGLTPDPIVQSRRVPQKNNVKACLKKKYAILQIIEQSEPESDAVNKYLSNRGLGSILFDMPSDLRAIDSLRYYENGELLGYYPAMISIVRDTKGEVVTVHRTYLSSKGSKARVTSPKKMMPPAKEGDSRGCAIQLVQPANQLAVAEGVETALAVYLATGIPTWAAISANSLEQLNIPAHVDEVIIMADKDLSGVGEKSAQKLAGRICGQHSVKIVTPSVEIPPGQKSVDWLDVYQHTFSTNSLGGEHE